jgi:HlyD family secretion protein
MNPDIKVYPAEVYINGDASSLRPGMTCRVDIIVEEISDALYIPVQSVVRVNNQPVVYVDGVNGVESRPVEIGLDNDRVIRIVRGLSEGEKVLLRPPLAPSEAPLAGAPSTVPDAKEAPTEAADEKEAVK